MTKNSLIMGCLPLVDNIARSLHENTVVSHDDLVQAGSIGLMQAAEVFDESRGIPFSHFAALRIRGAMIDLSRANDHMSRSRRDKEKAGGTTLPKLYHFSASEELNNTTLAANTPNPARVVESRDIIAKGLSGFTPEERLMINLRYVEGLSQREIGKAIGITESRVSQLFMGAQGYEGIDARFRRRMRELAQEADACGNP